MPSIFIPTQEELLSNFLGTFVTNATGHEVQMGLTVAQVTAINDAKDDWDNALAAYKTAEEALKGLLAAKNAAKAAAIGLVREANTAVQSKPGVSEELKSKCGLPVYDETRTRAAAPTTRPMLTIDASQRLQHKIGYRDESSATSRAKPDGVREIEVWCKIGAPAPLDAGECALVGTSSRNGLVITHKGADAGKPAHYMARWKNTRGECGPWSETVIATIGA